jgi:hypothetical protein
MSLPTRKIGNDNVTAIGYGMHGNDYCDQHRSFSSHSIGAMGISAFYGKTDPDEVRLKVCFTFYDPCVSPLN